MQDLQHPIVVVTSPLRKPRTTPTKRLKPRSAILKRKRMLPTTKGSTSLKTPKPKKKIWKFKKTEVSECDSAFSKEILERDGHCLFPGCEARTNLTNSHYIGRSNWNTRFDPENCIALCIRHHFMDRDTAFEFQKAREEKHGWDGQYTLFQRKFIGETGFTALLERANEKKSRKDAIIEAQKKYGLRQPVDNAQTSPQTVQ